MYLRAHTITYKLAFRYIMQQRLYRSDCVHLHERGMYTGFCVYWYKSFYSTHVTSAIWHDYHTSTKPLMCRSHQAVTTTISPRYCHVCVALPHNSFGKGPLMMWLDRKAANTIDTCTSTCMCFPLPSTWQFPTTSLWLPWWGKQDWM
jgi:hypothetical protein